MKLVKSLVHLHVELFLLIFNSSSLLGLNAMCGRFFDSAVFAFKDTFRNKLNPLPWYSKYCCSPGVVWLICFYHTDKDTKRDDCFFKFFLCEDIIACIYHSCGEM